MVPRWGTLILLVVASGDAALLNRVAQRLSARRVRDALIAPVISDAPTLAEPERVDTWRRVRRVTVFPGNRAVIASDSLLLDSHTETDRHDDTRRYELQVET